MSHDTIRINFCVFVRMASRGSWYRVTSGIEGQPHAGDGVPTPQHEAAAAHCREGKRPMRWIRLALVALLLLVFAGAAPTSAQSSVPRFEPGACPFLENPGFVEGKNLRCGYLVVPENRGAANGRTIRLAVAIFRPKTVKGQDPVFFLSGGPGDPLLSVMGLAISRSNAAVVMGGHPIVLLDQRGTG